MSSTAQELYEAPVDVSFEEESAFQDAGDPPFDRDGKKPPLLRSTAFWASDGNVVIVADRTAAFRVHRGVLARHSSVFKDLFELPQKQSSESPDEDDKLDGCPVVHVTDSPADFAYLLKLLYDGVQ